MWLDARIGQLTDRSGRRRGVFLKRGCSGAAFFSGLSSHLIRPGRPKMRRSYACAYQAQPAL